MASLLASKYVLGKFPRLFAPAVSRSEIILGGLGKTVYESVLLQVELQFYAGTSAISALAFSPLMHGNENSLVFVPLALVAATTAAGLSIHVPEIVAVSRTAYSVHKKTLQIVNLQ